MKDIITKHVPALLAGLLLFGLFIAPVQAKPDRLKEDQLAQHHVVIQISQGNGFKQKLVLNNASNMLKHYGPDLIQIEVVAYGPGLRLLFRDNPNSKRIKRLMKEGVIFSACANTMHAMHKKVADLVPGARKIPGGVVQIMERQEEGWDYIKP